MRRVLRLCILRPKAKKKKIKLLYMKPRVGEIRVSISNFANQKGKKG